MFKQIIIAAALMSVSVVSSAVELTNDTAVKVSVLDQLKAEGHVVIGTMEWDDSVFVMLDSITGSKADAICTFTRSIVDTPVYLFSYGTDARPCA